LNLGSCEEQRKCGTTELAQCGSQRCPVLEMIRGPEFVAEVHLIIVLAFYELDV
jgi:hypothetical protein